MLQPGQNDQLAGLLDTGASARSRGFSKQPGAAAAAAAAAAQQQRGAAVMARLAAEDRERRAGLQQQQQGEAPKKSMVQEHRERLAAAAAAGGGGGGGAAAAAAPPQGPRPAWDRDAAMTLQTTANPHFRSAVGGFEQPGGGGPAGSLRGLPPLESRFR